MAARLIHKDFVGAYVYEILVDGLVRYVGKGRRYRAVEHFRVAKDLNARRAKGEKVKAQFVHNKLAKAIRNDAKIEYKILACDLSDVDAYAREIIEIASYPQGQLWNVHRGGSGGDADMMRRMWTDPEYREKTIAAARKGRTSPEYLARVRATTVEQWSDPEFRERWTKQHRSVWDDPTKAAERRSLLKKVWSDPEKSARKSALVKSQWTPERKAAMSENRRKAWSDPEFKRKASENIRKSRINITRPTKYKTKATISQLSLL